MLLNKENAMKQKIWLKYNVIKLNLVKQTKCKNKMWLNRENVIAQTTHD